MRLNTIRQELEAECHKLISRYGVSVASAKRQQRLFNKRTWIQSREPGSYSPKHWDIAPEFNPFYVRKRIPQFAHAISARIENGTYRPKPSLHIEIPKSDGESELLRLLQLLIPQSLDGCFVACLRRTFRNLVLTHSLTARIDKLVTLSSIFRTTLMKIRGYS